MLYNTWKEQATTETVVKQTKQEFKANKDDMRAEINKIDILPIVMDTRWLDWFKDRGDIITLRDSKRNIGAYVYKPNNCVVTTGTSRAKTKVRRHIQRTSLYLMRYAMVILRHWKNILKQNIISYSLMIKKKFLDISIPNKTYFGI